MAWTVADDCVCDGIKPLQDWQGGQMSSFSSSKEKNKQLNRTHPSCRYASKTSFSFLVYGVSQMHPGNWIFWDVLSLEMTLWSNLNPKDLRTDRDQKKSPAHGPGFPEKETAQRVCDLLRSHERAGCKPRYLDSHSSAPPMIAVCYILHMCPFSPFSYYFFYLWHLFQSYQKEAFLSVLCYSLQRLSTFNKISKLVLTLSLCLCVVVAHVQCWFLWFEKDWLFTKTVACAVLQDFLPKG